MVDEGMPGVATIPAGVPFVEALAAGLLAEAATAPHALADALILLPTRRACRLLAEALLRRSSSQALLLPRIQPLGEIDADEVLVERRPRALCLRRSPPLRRQLLLARLFERSGWPMIHALRLAEELAALLDELQTERVPLDALASLVPDHLAEHWQTQPRRAGGDCRGLAATWPRKARSTPPNAGTACSPNWPRSGARQRPRGGSSPPARPAASRRRVPCSG